MSKASKATDSDILEAMEKGREYRLSEIAALFNVCASNHAISKNVKWMVDQEVLTKINRGHAKLYSISEMKKSVDNVAVNRSYEFKEMKSYNLKAHMEACESARSLKNGGLI